MRKVVSPTSGQSLIEVIGDDRERIEVRGLALVGTHPGRGVPLHVLDRAEALAISKLQVRDSHVVLEVDKGLCRAGSAAPPPRAVRRSRQCLRQPGKRGVRMSPRALLLTLRNSRPQGRPSGRRRRDNFRPNAPVERTGPERTLRAPRHSAASRVPARTGAQSAPSRLPSAQDRRRSAPRPALGRALSSRTRRRPRVPTGSS